MADISQPRMHRNPPRAPGSNLSRLGCRPSLVIKTLDIRFIIVKNDFSASGKLTDFAAMLWCAEGPVKADFAGAARMLRRGQWRARSARLLVEMGFQGDRRTEPAKTPKADAELGETQMSEANAAALDQGAM